MTQRKRLQKFVMILALLGLVLGSTGCPFAGQLSEEAKPQTIPEKYILGVAEFNRVAMEANLWMDGVLQQAAIGDVSASTYVPIAERLGDIIHQGNLLIQAGQVAYDAGDLSGMLTSGNLINNALTLLQQELLAAGVGAP